MNRFLEETVKAAAIPRQSFVNNVFASVAGRYDVMNDVMSFGVHRLWKQALFAKINPRPFEKFLDVAGGTGDVALGIVNALKNHTQPQQVTVCDINPAMSSVGRARAADKGVTKQLKWVCGDAAALPLPDNTYDVYTIAFGLRNVTDRLAALREARRVLRTGGRFYCLEFSPTLTLPSLQKAYDAYSFKALPAFGGLIAKDKAAYQYLAESIRTFPAPNALIKQMEQAGFQHCGYETWSLGVVALHYGINI